MDYWWEERCFGGEEGGIGDVVGGGSERLTDRGSWVISFQTDGLTRASSAI